MRIGIVGCGLIGEKRAAAAHNHSIIAVNDLDTERAADFARKYSSHAVKHWQNVISADVEAVLVATTHAALAEITLAAVQANRHVLVEKPAGRNAAEISLILAAAHKHKRIVKAGFNHRFHPAVLKAKELVDAGEAGPLLYIRARYGHGGRLGMEKEWRCQADLSGGGELIDQMPHLIDLSRWFLGDLQLEYGIAPTLYWPTAVDDNCFMALRTAKNQIAWLHATWVEWKNMFSFEIVGRNAKLSIDGLGGSYGTERLTFHRMLPEMGPPETTVWEYPLVDTSWQLEFDDFVAAIEQNRRPSGDISDAFEVLKIVDQVYKKEAA